MPDSAASYLVTGAAGFIGARVARLLLDQGHHVVGVDEINTATDPRLKHWRLGTLEGRERFRFIRADIADPDAMRTLFAENRFEAVFNLAARAGVRQSVETPELYVHANVSGTLTLLRACVEHQVGKFVLSSTSSLYGGDNPRPYVETLNTDHVLSPYAASKKAAEAFCYTYHHLFGIDVTVLRYFTVYGPAGRPDMAPFRFVQWIREGQPLILYGDGRQERDFTYVDDVADATVRSVKPLGYEVINVGSDRPIVLADFIASIEQMIGSQAVIERRPRHPADVVATWADIGKAERLLGWRPRTAVDEGLRSLVEWYEENRAWARDIDTR